MRGLLKLTGLLFATILILVFTSCEKFEISGEETLVVKKITYSGCKSSNKKSLKTETITLKAINDNELKITHSNVVFPCCPNGELKAEAYRSNDTIFLNEYYTDISCDCLCPYDLEYTIGKLDYGKYTVVLKIYNHEHFTFKFNFNPNTDKTITIRNN